MDDHRSNQQPPTPEISLDELTARIDDLEVLVKKNIQWNEVVYNEVKRVRRRLTFMSIGSYVRLILLLTPFILGFIFLPPLIRQMKGTFESIIQPGKNAEESLNRAINTFKVWQSASSTNPER